MENVGGLLREAKGYVAPTPHSEIIGAYPPPPPPSSAPIA